MASSNGSDGARQRTEQERELAREERQRRRLARGGAGAAPAETPPLPPPRVEPASQAAPAPRVEPAPRTQPEPQAEQLQQAAPPSERLSVQANDRQSGSPPSQAYSRRGGAGRGGARAGVWIGLAIVLVALIAGGVLLLKPTNHPAPVPPPPKIVRLTIPEGYTRAQIALRARADGVSGSYLAASVRSGALDPAHRGAPAGTPNLEGFLFPATYEIYAREPASRLVSRQLAAFEENFGEAQIRRAKALGITSYQLLIVASMVEREAQVPGDRAKIAAVIYNRLRAGMPLGIDATIYYAVEQQRHIATYTGELTESQLHIDSPYNTRLHTGLPPTPISNPGLASIEAAAHPAHVPYLYYVAGADGCGEQAFSTTQAGFEQNVAAYHAALARNGGHPPACKHR